MNRRHFLRSAVATTSTLAIPAFALEADNPYRKEIGIQLYTLRNELKADTPATIKAVAEAGYYQVEPYGFPDAGAIEMIQAAKDNGMKVNSSHFNWESVTNPDKQDVTPFNEILRQASEMGLTHLVIPYIHAPNRETLDHYKKLAERCNEAAVLAKEAGIQLAYHNHAFEFENKEGDKCGYDIFRDEFADEMKFEVDVFWVKAGGVEPTKLIKKLTGRVSQLHLKDLKDGLELPYFDKMPNDAFQELGDGIIPMEPIIKAAAEAGVAHCHVEQDQSPDPLASIQQSMAYLKGL